jgi:hypothetical protein
MMQTDLDREVYGCGDCRIFDPDNQPSVARRISLGWNPIVWSIENGMTLSAGPGLGTLALESEIVACKKHEAALIAVYGWDGTGDKQ